MVSSRRHLSPSASTDEERRQEAATTEPMPPSSSSSSSSSEFYHRATHPQPPSPPTSGSDPSHHHHHHPTFYPPQNTDAPLYHGFVPPTRSSPYPLPPASTSSSSIQLHPHLTTYNNHNKRHYSSMTAPSAVTPSPYHSQNRYRFPIPSYLYGENNDEGNTPVSASSSSSKGVVGCTCKKSRYVGVVWKK